MPRIVNTDNTSYPKKGIRFIMSDCYCSCPYHFFVYLRRPYLIQGKKGNNGADYTHIRTTSQCQDSERGGEKEREGESWPFFLCTKKWISFLCEFSLPWRSIMMEEVSWQSMCVCTCVFVCVRSFVRLIIPALQGSRQFLVWDVIARLVRDSTSMLQHSAFHGENI